MRIISSVVAALCCLMVFAGLARAEGYRLKPGDILDVSVWQEPKLNRQVTVAPDGRISLPLVGHLRAGGTTVEVVESTIKTRLAKQYTTDIDVTVALLSIKEKPKAEKEKEEKIYPSIYVTGEVAKPGKYEVREPVNVLQAIAMSGGLGPFAAERRIKIRRKTEGGEHLYDFDYEAFVSGDDMSGNIRLRANDVVIVPERGFFE